MAYDRAARRAPGELKEIILDPVSQAVVGAVAAQCGVRRMARFGAATLCGVAGGLAPDLDVLLRSPTDPLLFLEYHRQFTHALAFIPFGALLVAAVLWMPLRRILGFRTLWWFCTLGYASHGLLDACTSYGTQLLWPFSTTRIAWDTISIVDPLFTLPLLILVGVTLTRRQRRWALIAVGWIVLIMGMGVVQRERVVAAAQALADGRGHSAERLVAKPSFGNQLLWKTIYLHDGRYWVDAVRAGAGIKIFPGDSVARLNPGRDLPWLDPASQQARDVERFRWFSDDYLALSPRDPQLVIDMRYSLVPDTVRALWGIRLERAAPPTQHAQFESFRSVSATDRARFVALLRDRAD